MTRRDPERRSAAALLVLVLLGGCAAGHMAAPASRASVSEELEPHEQVRRLEALIAQRRSEIGLGPAGAADRAVQMAEPAAPAASETQGGAAPPGPTGRCANVCRAGQDICGYSRRICRLAEQIGDDESRRSCQHAEGECAEATRICTTCNP